MSCGCIGFLQKGWPARFGCLPAACILYEFGAMLPKAHAFSYLLCPVEITPSVRAFLS
jgi:hypothetical protein